MMTETAIGKSHLPQLLDHAHPLFEAETAREGGGEAVQIRCLARSRIGELEQARHFVVGERKPARQRIDRRLALLRLAVVVGAHHLHQEHGRGELEHVLHFAHVRAWRHEQGGEELFQGLDHEHVRTLSNDYLQCARWPWSSPSGPRTQLTT